MGGSAARSKCYCLSSTEPQFLFHGRRVSAVRWARWGELDLRQDRQTLTPYLSIRWLRTRHAWFWALATVLQDKTSNHSSSLVPRVHSLNCIQMNLGLLLLFVNHPTACELKQAQKSCRFSEFLSEPASSSKLLVICSFQGLGDSLQHGLGGPPMLETTTHRECFRHNGWGPVRRIRYSWDSVSGEAVGIALLQQDPKPWERLWRL